MLNVASYSIAFPKRASDSVHVIDIYNCKITTVFFGKTKLEEVHSDFMNALYYNLVGRAIS